MNALTELTFFVPLLLNFFQVFDFEEWRPIKIPTEKLPESFAKILSKLPDNPMYKEAYTYLETDFALDLYLYQGDCTYSEPVKSNQRGQEEEKRAIAEQ